jgi:hypothetical protein
MGWIGIVLLGAVTGLASWWLHPSRRAGRAATGWAGRVSTAVAIGIVAAAVARMLGNIVGAFHDGDSLEWLACVFFALLAVTVTLGLSARR